MQARMAHGGTDMSARSTTDSLEGLLLKKDFTQLNIYIWGMGAKGREFWKRYAYFEEIYKLLPSLQPRIIAVVDSACVEQGAIFFGRQCIHPREIRYRGHEDLFVIAVEHSAGIRRSLLEKGYDAESMIFYEDFLEVMCRNLLSMREQILRHFFPDVGDDCFSVYGKAWDEEMFRWVGLTCRELDNFEYSPQCRDLLKALLLSEFFCTWEHCSPAKKPNLLHMARQQFDMVDLLAGAELYYGMDIRHLADYFERYPVEPAPRKVKVIGIYDKRYRNGGGQKVLSMLMPIYIEQGYRVVFFTEEYCPGEEYALPDEVVRVVLPEECATDRQARWCFLLEHINRNGVQVMCFHNCESGRQFFFDLLWLHFHNIPVLMEMHMNFMSLFESRSGITKFLPHIYKSADCLVVLSRCDEVFWQHLGCRARYIPNPLEKIERAQASEKRTGKRILWIGRLEDGGKRFSDAVDIMELVSQKVPDAMLDVVGCAESEVIEKRLQAYIVSKGLAEKVVLHGYSISVGGFYADADVMLFTSRREGFPLVIAESKQYGLPLVMYELPYLELLRNGQGVIAVPQGRKQAAADALIDLLTDEDLRRRMSVQAKRSLDWLRCYDIGKAWDELFAQIGEPQESDGKAATEFGMVERLLLDGMEDCKQG